MIQQVIIGLLFLGAFFFVARMLYRSFQTKSGCATGCAKCNTVDFEKIEQQLKEKGI